MGRVFAATTVLLLLANTARAESATCPTTPPPTHAFVPPPPYWQTAPGGTFWYGNDGLWTELSAESVWHTRGNVDKDGGYMTKLIFWHRGFDWRNEFKPKFSFTGRRLDAAAPPITIHGATPVFVPTAVSAMMIGLHVPTPGCWKFTARYHGNALKFVVSVEP